MAIKIDKLNNYENVLIPTVGIHAAGKTRLLSSLEKSGFLIEAEIAEFIRKNKNIKAGAAGDSSFDMLVLNEEIHRDKTRKWVGLQPIFVESWVILSIAYLRTRGLHDDKLKYYINYIKEYMKHVYIYCIFLDADPASIPIRSTRLHSIDKAKEYYCFYKRLNENIYWVLEKLNMPYLVVDASQKAENIFNLIYKFINSKFISQYQIK